MLASALCRAPLLLRRRTLLPALLPAGVIPEVRRRRYFENSVDAKKRKTKEARMAAKRQQAIRNYAQVSGQEPAPFSDMFGSSEDLEIYF